MTQSRVSKLQLIKFIFIGVVFTVGLFHILDSFSKYLSQHRIPSFNEDFIFYSNLSQDDPMLIEYTKSKFLIAPSAKEYNLKNPLEDPAKNEKQHLYALKILNNMKNGFFIECGANDGETLSTTLVLERDYGWNGLLVEPDPSVFPELIKKNRKAWISPTCLSVEPRPQKVNFAHSAQGSVFSGIQSLLMSNVAQNKLNTNINATCLPIFTLLSALKVKTVDFFCLDVEGAELKVLQTIPFDSILIKVITIEYNHIREGPTALKKFMQSKGFVFFKEIYGPAIADLMFVHESLKENIRNVKL